MNGNNTMFLIAVVGSLAINSLLQYQEIKDACSEYDSFEPKGYFVTCFNETIDSEGKYQRINETDVILKR